MGLTEAETFYTPWSNDGESFQAGGAQKASTPSQETMPPSPVPPGLQGLSPVPSS